MSDIKVKLTEQSIGVPNTGLFTILNSNDTNIDNDGQYGLIVGSCVAITIVLILTTIAIITKKSSHRVYANSNSHFSIHSTAKAKTTLGLSIIMLLSASILIPLASGYYNDNQESVSAATSDTLTLSTKPISIDAELTNEDAITAVSNSITVTSATNAGYTLSVYASDKDLIPTEDAITTKIAGLSTDDAEATTLSSNTWGIAITAPEDSSSKVWYAIPASESAALTIKETNDATEANDITTVWYGVNVNSKLEAGEYAGTINYIAVANVNTEPTPDPEPDPIPPSPDPEPTPEPEPDPEPVGIQINFENTAWEKYGDMYYTGYLEACNGATPEFVNDGHGSYHTTCEPDAGQHITFPDSTSIRLIGSTMSAVDLGVYYDRIPTDKAFSMQVDIDASTIGTHPAEFGAFTVNLSAVDEFGQVLLPDAAKATIAASASTLSALNLSEEITSSSRDFTLLFTHQDGEFHTCAIEPGKEPQCISVAMFLPDYAFLKIDFNLKHDSHACSSNAFVELHDVDIRLGNGAITF